MNDLPASEELSVESLTASFRNVTNSYKFFWFLSILAHLQENHSRVISIDDLLARMVAWIWYPSCYFKLSFGKQDQLVRVVDLLLHSTELQPADKRKKVIVATLAQLASGSRAGQAIREIRRYVPTRFLRPFFAKELMGIADHLVDPALQRLAATSFETSSQPCIYRFISLPQPAIEIHERWYTYLINNLYLLNGFCLWHLLNYLQGNNPNVPNIASKLFEPSERNLRQAQRFWKLSIAELADPRCIYSHQPLKVGPNSLDHFLPWRFIGHDLLWNIVPTSRSVNSSKSDRLPDIALYFDSFAQLQYDAVKVIAAKSATHLLEDYIMLFKVESVEALSQIHYVDFQRVLGDTLKPQVQVARNMGFVDGWRYQ